MRDHRADATRRRCERTGSPSLFGGFKHTAGGTRFREDTVECDMLPKRKTRPGLTRELWKKPALRSLLLALLAARLRRPAGERCPVDLECYPGIPYHRHMLWKVALYARAKLLHYPDGVTGKARRRPTLRVFWPDTSAVRELLPGRPSPPASWRLSALNGSAGGQSKRHLERVFAQVFGYELAVDPRVHVGPCVAKSDRRNGAHDGRLLICPIADPDPELAYEVLVDNRADGVDTVVDFRVPIVGGEIPFVYRKYRPLRTRFGNANTAVELAAPGEVFSDDERARLRAFGGAMGLDLGGEVDVLRDRGSGRLYVVDANPTSWGPPRPIATADAVRAVRAYAIALTQLAEPSALGEKPDGTSFENEP
jgi:hypothetical protein